MLTGRCACKDSHKPQPGWEPGSWSSLQGLLRSLEEERFFFFFWPGEKYEAILWECTVKQRLWIMVQRETTRIFCGTLKRLVSSFLLVRTSRIALSLHKEL